MASESVHEFTDDNFDNEVINSDAPVLVDFWAPWCGPCRQIAPMIDELAAENPKVKIGKVNIDEHQALAAEYNVKSIPLLLFFKDGEVKDQIVGVAAKDAIAAKLDEIA